MHNYLHILLQTHFNPTRTNATVHQLNVAPNQVKIPKSPSKYNTPTTNTVQLNQHGHPPSGHTPLIAFFAIINHPSMKFFDFTVFLSFGSLSYLNIYDHWGMKILHERSECENFISIQKTILIRKFYILIWDYALHGYPF
jgi:hypothetical protein